MDYAVLIDESENKITLVKDRKIEINFDKDTISQIFASSMLSLLRSKFDSNEAGNFDHAISLDDVSESKLCKIEEYFIVQLKNEELFDKFFYSLKDDGIKLLFLYKKLSEYESITRHCVDKYIAELKTSKATEKGDYSGPWWSLYGGIEVAGYTGIYFNQEIAEYLKLRAEFWPDNRTKVLKILKRIHDSLTDSSIHKSQIDYAVAVKAYNQCIEHFHEQKCIKSPPNNEGGQVITEELNVFPLEESREVGILGEAD